MVYQASYNNTYLKKSEQIEKDIKGGLKNTNTRYLLNMKNKDMGGNTISNF